MVALIVAPGAVLGFVRVVRVVRGCLPLPVRAFSGLPLLPVLCPPLFVVFRS
jgi:hypothetical protein